MEEILLDVFGVRANVTTEMRKAHCPAGLQRGKMAPALAIAAGATCRESTRLSLGGGRTAAQSDEGIVHGQPWGVKRMGLCLDEVFL